MKGTKKDQTFQNPNDNDIYSISVCGTSKDCCNKPPCVAAACKKSDQSGQVMLSKKELSLSESGLRLQYKAEKSDAINYVIDFICDRNTGHLEMGNMKNVSFDSDENVWFFEYRTSLGNDSIILTGTISINSSKQS